MENMLVVVFDSEEQAQDASRALDELQEAGTIGLKRCRNHCEVRR